MHPRPRAETSSVPSLRLFIAAPVVVRFGRCPDDRTNPRRSTIAARRETMPPMPATGKSAHGEAMLLEVGARSVRITSPERVYFSTRGETKLDLARYYVSVGQGIVRALR